MNYYEHHIGDYDSATAHLSLIEDAIYRRLICLYYRLEGPLPADPKAVARLTRISKKSERSALASILNEFFILENDGWHNERCNGEVARFKDKQDKAKRSARARWDAKRTHSEGNANASPNAMRTHSEGNAPRARPQSPDTNQKQNQASTVNSGENLAPARDPASTRTDRAPKPIPANAQACIAMREAGAVRVNPSHPVLLAGLEEGATPAMYGDAVREAIDRGKGEPFAYAISAVRGQLVDAKRTLPENRHGKRPQRIRGAVAETLAAIERRREREGDDPLPAGLLETRGG